MSSAKEPPEDGTTTSGSGTPAAPEATTRVDAVPAGENGGSERAESASGTSGSAAGSASSDGPAGGTPPPWQRAASAGAGAGGAAASSGPASSGPANAGPANAGPAGAPRSAPFPAQGSPRPSPAPHGPPGGARPESGPMPAARPGPESGAMPAGRPGGATAGAPRPGGGAGGGERPASSTALIDAPTNQLSPEQLGMRSDRDERSSDGPGADDAGARAPRGGGKAPRRASLQVRRFDPWSVLKLALVLGVALFFVWMFAVGVLYAVLDGMGVWAQLNGTYQDLTSDTGGGGGDLITAAGVFGVAAVIGVVNTILFTALASVSAFIYNISADVAGGIEVTLSERD